MSDTHDPVNHPSHYTSDPSGVECITITRHRNFNVGNAIKYLWRAGLKDEEKTVEDLRKAIFYINDEINRLQGVVPGAKEIRGTVNEKLEKALKELTAERKKLERHDRVWGPPIPVYGPPPSTIPKSIPSPNEFVCEAPTKV